MNDDIEALIWLDGRMAIYGAQIFLCSMPWGPHLFEYIFASLHVPFTVSLLSQHFVLPFTPSIW